MPPHSCHAATSQLTFCLQVHLNNVLVFLTQKKAVRIKFVERVPIFQSMGRLCIEALCLALTSFLTIPAEAIITQGQEGREMYFINRGKVQVVLSTPSTPSTSGHGANWCGRKGKYTDLLIWPFSQCLYSQRGYAHQISSNGLWVLLRRNSTCRQVLSPSKVAPIRRYSFILPCHYIASLELTRFEMRAWYPSHTAIYLHSALATFSMVTYCCAPYRSPRKRQKR